MTHSACRKVNGALFPPPQDPVNVPWGAKARRTHRAPRPQPSMATPAGSNSKQAASLGHWLQRQSGTLQQR